MAVFSYDTANLSGMLNQVIAQHPPFVSLYTDGGHAATIFDAVSLQTAGIGILWNHENAPNELAGGYAAGVAAAQHAIAPVIAAGTPTDGTVAVFYSVDVDIPTTAFQPWVDAFAGINVTHAGRFRVGCYGEGALINELVRLGLVQVKGWLSASSSYPGYDPKSPNVGLVQMVSTNVVGTDQNEVTDITGLGIWWAPGQPYVNDPPLKLKEDDDMANPFLTLSTPEGIWLWCPNIGAYEQLTLITDVYALQQVGAPSVTGAVTEISADLHAKLKAIWAALQAKPGTTLLPVVPTAEENAVATVALEASKLA